MAPLNIEVTPFHLINLSHINIVMGKNGCGKSTLLKGCDAVLPSSGPPYGLVRYITPERGGDLLTEPNVELNMANAGWLESTRRNNQFAQFRQQSVVQYRRLETEVLRAVQDTVRAGTTEQAVLFDSVIADINSLLDNIKIVAVGNAFEIKQKATDAPIDVKVISSGEGELISLAIECLAFVSRLIPGRTNLLLLDEPDVHLHPDLQSRFMRFLIKLVDKSDFVVVLATHSTALLSELTNYADARVAFMRSGETNLTFKPVGKIYQRILPVFGAHPLSNVFNQAPLLLVEGEDDERVWQRVVRTAGGKLHLFPVATGGTGELPKYEDETLEIISAVYDDPKLFSIRDGDGVAEESEDTPPLVRMRLACRAIENLMLTDEVLFEARVDWKTVQARIHAWLASPPANHPKVAAMQAFADGGLDRQQADLKDIRNLLIGQMLGTDLDWELLVGKTLGKVIKTGQLCDTENSLGLFLGEKCRTVLNSLCDTLVNS